MAAHSIEVAIAVINTQSTHIYINRVGLRIVVIATFNKTDLYRRGVGWFAPVMADSS